MVLSLREKRRRRKKATMQMEALHYQRMLDEQAEYDQEALQLMNDIIVKREAEKQELEKELEIYRKKVTDYEALNHLLNSSPQPGTHRNVNSSSSLLSDELEPHLAECGLASWECPLDLKEAISSVCFASPRCADLPELLQVQMLIAAKSGREFFAAATALMPESGVTRQLIELLSVRAPPAAKKLQLLKEIAEEHGLDWVPAASETELFKPHEDLLNGPRQFVGGSQVPLPKEKHDEVVHSVIVEGPVEESDSEDVLAAAQAAAEGAEHAAAAARSAASLAEIIPTSQPPPYDAVILEDDRTSSGTAVEDHNGAQYYSVLSDKSARDMVGHEIHIASTAAGRIVKSASFYE